MSWSRLWIQETLLLPLSTRVGEANLGAEHRADHLLSLQPKKGKTNVIMMVGLQGAGKTTTCTKVCGAPHRVVEEVKR